MTSNDLWPPHKTIGIINTIWPTHILNVRSVTFTLLEISCLQGFDLLTSRDPKWPLTSTKNNRGHLLTMANPHTKYEISHTYASLDIVFTSNLQGFYHLTFSDLKWPLTSTKNHRDHLLYMANPHTKYEIPQSYSSWDIVFTKFWPFDLSWPQMTFDLHQKQ